MSYFGERVPEAWRDWNSSTPEPFYDALAKCDAASCDSYEELLSAATEETYRVDLAVNTVNDTPIMRVDAAAVRSIRLQVRNWVQRGQEFQLTSWQSVREDDRLLALQVRFDGLLVPGEDGRMWTFRKGKPEERQ